MKAWKLVLAAFVGLASLDTGAQTVEYVHTDALGTPVAVTNANRVVIERSEYEPYGKLMNRPLTDGPGYTGHVQDAATGLTYMQQRYYDPGVGRFLSVDPVTAVDNGDMRHFNRYSYAYNNPHKFTDPDGRNPAACLLPPMWVPCLTAAEKTVAAIVLIGTSLVLWNESRDDVEPAEKDAPESPEVNPADVAGKTPGEIEEVATAAGLVPKGSNPSSGEGAYVDPVTGKQRILVHPDASCGPHCHVNDADGNRLDINGDRVAPESPEAHLPLRQEN